VKCLRILVCSILVLALGLPSHSDEASSAYRRGVRAEAEKRYDAAFEAFREAYTLKPNEPKYITSYMRARAAAANEHVSNGIVLRDKQKMQDAILEFRHASEIDATSFVALQEIQRTELMIRKAAEAEHAGSENPATAAPKPSAEMEGPVELEPSPNSPVTLHMSTTADNVYRTIGKLSGINVLFDMDYKAQKITIDLNDVLPREALRMVALESKTFWRPISASAIFVTQESKRKENETNVMRTFYLRNVSNPAELQEVAGTLKGLLDVSRMQVNPTHSTITVRGTTDQLALAEKLIAEADKPKAEVIIDIEVLEVSRSRIQTLGTTVPTTASISVATAATLASGGSAGLVSLGSVNGGSWVTPIQGGSFTFLASDTNTKILQRPQVRTLDNEKATLKIGDRVPIATGSFTPGIGAGGISPLVNTQFQYLDVGVNIDITPHIHSDHEVTLKMVLEISSVTGVSNIGGISQPTIGQRRIEHETRLEDGEINLVGGILEDSETQSLSGYPWLMKIPILKYLFGQENKQRPQTEVIFAITPHIIRAEQFTEENQRLIEVGTGNNIGLRYKEAKPAKSAHTVAPQDKPAAKDSSHAAPSSPVAAPPGHTQQQPAGEPHSPLER
jgi:general secretion pathway protein D